MNISFFPLDITYKVVDEKALIHLYGRTQDGERVCLVDEQFKPYFYVKLKEGISSQEFMNSIKGQTFTYKGKQGTVTQVQVVQKVLGRDVLEVLRVFTDLPRSVPPVSAALKELEEVERTYEYDIPFARRYLLDKQITPLTLCTAEVEKRVENSRVTCYTLKSIAQLDDTTYTQPTLLAFDIETYNPNKQMSDPAQHPIIQLSLYGAGFEKVITWKDVNGYGPSVEVVENEEELLKKFAQYVNVKQPDILTGYFSDGFDFPYILKRAQKHKIKLDINLDYTSPRFGRGNQSSVEMTGIIHLDILNFIRRVTRMNLKTDSLKLDAVAQELLGEKKNEIDIENLAEYWDNSDPKLAEFAKYCLKDSQLTYEITQMLMPNIVEFVKLISLPIADIVKMRFAQFVEWYLIKRAQEVNMLIPNKPGRTTLYERQGQHVEGAFVYEPKPGIYDDVVVFDFRSLYPSIIVAHNISPETLNAPSEHKEIVPGHPDMWFATDRDGFFSTILEEIMNRRGRIKAMMKTADEKKKKLLDARQYSLKILLNSFYGYLGFFGARWYSKECAAAVTAYGRYHIHQVINKAEAEGFKVIYSDTDSIFITLDGRTYEEAMDFVDRINAELPEMMELEPEGFYKTALFVSARGEEGGAKKRYALCDEQGNVIIKGFEAVRRNTSYIAKEVQTQVIKTLLRTKNTQEATSYLKEVIKNLREKKIPNEKLVIVTQLTKPIEDYASIGPHVAVARQMRQRGERVEPGSFIRYIVRPGKGKISDRVSVPELTPEGDYDAEYYIDNQVIPAVERIFEVFNIDVKQLADKRNQSSLQSFF